MCWVLYSSKWLKSVLYHEPQHKTQPQHTTTNMSRRRPTFQRRWPSLSMATLSMDTALGATAPYESVDGAMPQVCSCRSSILCLGHRNATH